MAGLAGDLDGAQVQTADVRGTGRRAHAVRAALARSTLGCVLCAGIALWQPSAADAEIFKCKSPDGRILYSDSPCPGGGGEILIPDENLPIPVAKPATTGRNAGAPGAPAAPRADTVRAAGGYELSMNERQRVANLEQVQRSGDNDEKRQAARMEIAEIQRGTVSRMSSQDLRRKDGYWVDLGNLDQRRRGIAVQQLAQLFAGYQ